MKKLTAAMLAVLLLSGCSWMNGSYVSVTPHTVSTQRQDENARRVYNYAQLLGALTGMVDAGQAQGLFSMTDYSQEEIRREMEAASQYLITAHPIGAYAVDKIDYEYSSGGSNNILRVDVTYRHGRSDMSRIQSVRGIDGARKAIANAMRQFEGSLALQITDYTDTNFAQLVTDYAMDTPETVMEIPQVAYTVYPNKGNIRVVEMVFTYQTAQQDLKTMQENVLPIFSSAQLYISINAVDKVKLNQLYSFLTERFDYTYETSLTPSYSLLCHGVGDSRAFARVYAAMCRQVGLECKVVTGSRNGENLTWNMVRDGDAWYHVDILRSMAEGGYRQMADSEMTGYVWDYSAFPACGQPEQPQTAPTTP